MKLRYSEELPDKEYFIAKPVRNLPKCGIYFLIKSGEIVYVGKSVNIPGRISGHKKGKDFDYVSVFECKKENLDYFELAYCLKYRPALNKTIPGGEMDDKKNSLWDVLTPSRYFLTEDE